MLRKNSLFFFIIIVLGFCFSTVSFAQNYEVKLGGNTVDEQFNVKNSSGNTLFQVTGEGNIGMGTTSPSVRLELFKKFSSTNTLE